MVYEEIVGCYTGSIIPLLHQRFNSIRLSNHIKNTYEGLYVGVTFWWPIYKRSLGPFSILKDRAGVAKNLCLP